MSNTQTVIDNSNGTPAHGLAQHYRRPKEEHARLFIPGTSSTPIQLPIQRSALEGQRPAIDLAPLAGHYIGIDTSRKVHGYQSRICKVHPDGRLQIRGRDYNTEIARMSPLTAAYMVLTGDDDQRNAIDFTGMVESRMRLPNEAKDLLQAIPGDVDPMQQLLCLTSLLPSIHGKEVEMSDAQSRMDCYITCIAMMPVFAGAVVHNMHGWPIRSSGGTGDFVTQYSRLMMGDNISKAKVNFMRGHYLAHMEHDLNLSTDGVRRNASGGGTPFQALRAGINNLAVDNHGGAAAARVDQILQVMEGVYTPSSLVDAIKGKKALGMGHGHGVYRVQDPRFRELKPLVEAMIAEQGLDNDAFINAMNGIDEAFNEVSFLKDRQNVDCIGGPGAYICGLPRGSYTIPFAVSRVVGWMSHFEEEVANGVKIMRSRCFNPGWKS